MLHATCMHMHMHTPYVHEHTYIRHLGLECVHPVPRSVHTAPRCAESCGAWGGEGASAFSFMADQSHETGPRMRVLLTGADPGIPELVSRWQSTTVTVDGQLVQLRLIHVKPEGKGSFRSNSVMFRYMDVVVVLEPVEMQLMCTRRPGAAYISSGDIGGLKAKHFLGPEASDLASDAGLPLILVASAAHLRGQKREIHMGETHKEDFEAAANALGAATYLELSAETGQGVQELLQTAARLGLEGKWRRETYHHSSTSCACPVW